jgi:mRNA interferase MazF
MKGKIVLVPFPFTDLTAAKLRPSLVIYESENDVILAFISSKIPARLSISDIPLTRTHTGFSATGLKVDSVIKLDKIATVIKKLVVAELGEVNEVLKKDVNEKLKIVFVI